MMNETQISPRVALYVDDFLPYTHGWIYRQFADPVTYVKTVLCHQRSEEKTFPIAHCVKDSLQGKLAGYLRGRFWFFFKHFSFSLSKRTVKIFTKELQAQQINLVHAHFGTNGVLIAPVCKRLGIPLVVTFHGFDVSSVPARWPAYRKDLQSLFKQVAYAIAISEEMAERLMAIGCPKEKIKLSYLGVPVTDFPCIDRSGHTKPVVFLYAGRFTAKKGVPDLVHAFAQAYPKQGEAELWLVGDGEEKAEVMEAIKCRGLTNVKTFGMLAPKELQKVMSQADVFVMNSRTDKAGTKEGLPISILEACSSGMPVISTLHAGIPEAVQHNHTGLLVKENDTLALSLALRRMQDASLRAQMGLNASAFVKEKFSLERCNLQLSRLYQEVLNQGHILR